MPRAFAAGSRISASPGRRDGGRGTGWSPRRSDGADPRPDAVRTRRRPRGLARSWRGALPSDDMIVVAVPKGRISSELAPLFARLGVEPEAAFADPDSRQLRFATSDAGL